MPQSSEVQLVTVIIPARNEADDIASAIRSVGRQTYGAADIELVVVDGCSDDSTAEVAKRAFDDYPFRRSEVVSNPGRHTPSNLNRGLLWAEGDVIVRVDARSRIPDDYIERVARLLTEPTIAVAGGRQIAIPPHESTRGRGIARALNNSLGMGWSKYRRRGSASGPADTVYLGSFRRADLESVGGWGEAMASNQDFELNRRLAAVGQVWFESMLGVSYVPRSTLMELLSQYHRFGRWKVAYWRSSDDRPQPRQIALVALPAAAVGFGAGVVLVWGGSALAGLAGTGVVALFVLDHAGSEGESAAVGERVVAVLANSAVGVGWLTGIVRESIVPRLLTGH